MDRYWLLDTQTKLITISAVIIFIIISYVTTTKKPMYTEISTYETLKDSFTSDGNHAKSTSLESLH